MKFKARSPWKLLLAAPFVATAIVMSLWITLTAGQQNIRFVRATSQILIVLSAAREIRFDPAAAPTQATAFLLASLSRRENLRMRADPETGKPVIVNPWDGKVAVEVKPSLNQSLIQTAVSPAVCRRLALFYINDAASLGLLRAEVRAEALPEVSGRVLFDVKEKALAAMPSSGTASAGCRDAGSPLLLLTFRLQ